MNITGSASLSADRSAVWKALNDPAVLVATLPGCRQLEATGPDAYKMTIAAGVGSIKGVYDGVVRLSDHQEPESFRMHAQGAGAPGTIGAEVTVRLAEDPAGGTVLSYDADAVVGGMIGGVGQRMLAGASKKMADEFFRAVDAHLSPATVAPAPSVQPAGSTAGQVFVAPQKAGVPTQRGFMAGVAVGAAAALLGALVGGWIAGRRG
jgi:carbon monoxide dehydrogenase subunit G